MIKDGVAYRGAVEGFAQRTFAGGVRERLGLGSDEGS